MADETKRIIDQPVDTELSVGDFVIVDNDNVSEGTRKFDLGTELRDIKEDLSQLGEFEIYVEGTSLVINTNLVNGNEVSY